MRRLLALALLALVLPAAGSAAFPGTNGRLLFTQETDRLHRFSSPSAYLCAASARGFGATRAVAAPEGQFVLFPAVSPDGSRLAFSRAGRLGISSPDGSGERLLGEGTMPAWTPTGNHLVYVANGDLHIVAADGSGGSALTSGAPFDFSPAVSPDGAVVAFIRSGTTYPNGEQLVVVDANGRNERALLTRFGISAPDWSPDGRRLALTIEGSLYTLARDGSDLRRLTTETGDSEPAHSPDGTLIAFERGEDIWTMTTSGTDLANVTHSPVREYLPAWQTGTAATTAGSDRPCAIVGTEGDDKLVGSEYDDVFHDLGGDDEIQGLEGSDIVFDGEGVDEIDGGLGNDRIYLHYGPSVVHGGPGDDEIRAAAGYSGSPRPGTPASAPQQLYGEEGDDELSGGTAADRLDGGPGADRLDGLKGADVMFGRDGNDRIAGNRGDDVIDGGRGDDVLFGGLISGSPAAHDGYDLLQGGSGDDRLAGGWQKDRLFGGQGADRLRGGPHADHLDGGSGRDDLGGEGGDDLLVALDRVREDVWGGPGFDRARADLRDRLRGVERRIR
jgi:Ca2+-binding RTX toxin-like protein